MCYTNGPLVEKNNNNAMPMSLISNIIEEVGPHVDSISLTNWGEPFCDPHLPEILAAVARFPQVTLIFQTNGTLLDSRHLAPLKA